MATVIAVRHGQTTWNRERRIQGWTDSSLTDRGRRQAKATGARLADRGVDRLVVSDLRRTRETAAAFEGGGLTVEPTFSAAWRERGFGDYEGLTREELADRIDGFDPGDSLFLSSGAPGGESLADVRERVTGAFERLQADLDEGETAVVVTHGGPVRTLIGTAGERDLATVAREIRPANCGLTVIDAAGDPSLVGTDDATHLDSV